MAGHLSEGRKKALDPFGALPASGLPEKIDKSVGTVENRIIK